MDHIQKLMSQTGWTCDDLIEKIQEYKTNLVDLSPNDQPKSILQIDNVNKTISERCNIDNLLHHVSLVEVENDHSYTCRVNNLSNYEMQKKIHRQERRNFYEKHIKAYFERKGKTRSRKIYYPQKLKQRYRLQLKHATTDRKMLICKYKSQEVVRNEIMHQLELLRSKRTLTISPDVKQSAVCDTTVFSKKRYSGDKIKNEISVSEKDSVSSKQSFDTSVNDNGFQSYSNAVEPKLNNEKLLVKRALHSIRPTKTNDITKIKGWKYKKFLTCDRNKLHDGELQNTNKNRNNENMCENKSVVPLTKVDVKSAFASTNLDGFLHDSANLYVSFEIPALESRNDELIPNKTESQKQEMPSTSSFVNNNEDELLKVQKIDPLNLYRPRTLGQKRRIWKLKTDNRIKRKVEDVAKPRTLAEKRRMLDQDMDVKNKLKSGDVLAENNLKYSYILHRGKKLKIPTRTENDIIAYIKSHYGKKDYIYVPRKIRQNKIKPSIFTKASVMQTQVVKYRPGPLSKKAFLQEENKEWKTEIKKLPKIHLQVTPEANKPIWPKITHLLPQYDFDLTEERIAFALTALRSNRTNKFFTFPVPYANKQENLLLRRRINQVEESVVNTEDKKSLEENVEYVINKMLDYVEIKNISEEVLRDDVTEKILREEKVSINEQINNISKKRKTKQSKTNYELKRLNVKVIEVNLEDKGENDDCKKDFCRLGCVCKSLTTTSSLVSNHCGVPECMFGCKCNYEKKSKGNLKVTLPIGIDLLSEGAVNRLEVEAKKNLARVEKEFTQTVIQANNQTIVVGGCTNRQRRVTKLPKKYTDFIEDAEEVSGPVQVIDDEKEENCEIDDKLKNWKPVPCTIHMSKINLEEVVPFCMVHLLHDCYCDYKVSYEKEEVTEEVVEPKSEIIKANELLKDELSDGIDNTRCCARTKGLPTNYYLVRNKTERFISSRRRRLDKMYRDYMDKEDKLKGTRETEDKLKNIKETEDKLKSTKETEEINVQDVEELEKSDTTSSNKANSQINTQVSEKKTRRKQSLLVRTDSPPNLQIKQISMPENAIQRRKKLKKYINTESENKKNAGPISNEKAKKENKTISTLSEEKLKLITDKNLELRESEAKFDQIFQILTSSTTTNHFTPSLSIQEKLNQILGKNVGNDTQFRLIPWDILVKKYETNSLQLWYSTFFKKPRIIATDNKTIPKHFVNVKNYEHVANKDIIKADLIRWLVTRNVPGGNCKENIFVIVQLTKTHCELCGLWEKKQNKSDMMLLTQTSENINADNQMYSIVRKIMFSKCKFSKQMLVETTPSENSKKIPAITAYLPQIANNSKWRMIKLNSDFSVLSLHRNKYAIKYSDLQKVMKMAKETSFTIVLKTRDVEANYPHPDFGMYASPECDDMIFIGPYYHYEDHDITTLRYANRELIRTDIFCRMKGLQPACLGIWLYQLTMVIPPIELSQTIDLTECESDSELKLTEKKQEYSRSLLKAKIDQVSSIKKKNKRCPLITSSDLLNYESCATNYYVPTDFYKYLPKEVDISQYHSYPIIYFVPTIPNIGHIMGYKLENSIIVRWPTTKHIVNFPDITDATRYLERELNVYFIKKLSFKISIQILSNVNSPKTELFDSNMLKGYYIASDKGVIPLLEITKGMLKRLSMTLEEIEIFGKLRAQRMIFDKCYELAKKLFSPAKIESPGSSNDIIQMIINEIKQQEKLGRDLLVWHNKLSERKQSLRVKCTSVIKELSPLVSNKMKSAMLKILSYDKNISEEKSVSSPSDVICIDIDSDEDVSKNTTAKQEKLSTTSSTPKITVKKLQDLREPTTSANQTSKLVNVKSFSILKTKSLNSKTAINSGSQKVGLSNENTQNPIASSETGSNGRKTLTIKRSLLNKKCSKFVIKTSTGKYMTIRAENVKQLPVKRLQPLSPSDPVISKLNPMNTKRIIMPAKANGFVKVNFNDSSNSNDKIVNQLSSTENRQESYQSSSKPI